MFKYLISDEGLYFETETDYFDWIELINYLENNGFRLMSDNKKYIYLVDNNQNMYVYTYFDYESFDFVYNSIYDTLKRKGYAFAPKVLPSFAN